MSDIFKVNKYVYIYIKGKRVSEKDFHDKYGYDWHDTIDNLKDLVWFYGMSVSIIEPINKVKIRVVAR